MGDGALVEFASVVDAVRCAVLIQQGMAEREAEVPEAERIRFRIGINLGDVIHEADGDLYGDGVNVAARLESSAEPGGITVSGTAYDHLQGKLDCGLTALGERQLKNIERPVRVYQVQLPAGGTHAAGSRPATVGLPRRPRSLSCRFSISAETPRRDISAMASRRTSSPSCRGFGPWRLSPAPRRSSSATRRCRVQEIGRTLGAAFIVEGSVRRLGDRLRITAQLIETATGRHLWADRYDRDVAELFALQDEVVRNLVYTVATRLSEEIRETARRKRPEDLDAYDCFLRGNHLMDGSPQEQAEAAALFEQARALDPGFARAYTGLVWVSMMRSFAPMPAAPRAAILEEAFLLAEQALGLDPGDARVHLSAGWVCLFRTDFSRAQLHLDRAVALNANDPMILITWAWARACLGDPEPALAAAREAMRLDPWIHWYPARIEFLARHHAEALAHLDAATSTGPRWSAWRTATLAHLGRLEDARAEGARFVQSTAMQWRGDEAAGASEYCAWILDSTPLRLQADREHLRDGLRIANLPA